MKSTGERFTTQTNGKIALEHLHRYALAVDIAAGKRVLDIACGEGYGSNLLARVADSVTGVDISTEAISHAKVKYTSPNLRFHEGSCTSIPATDKSFDLVVSFETIEHIVEHEAFLSEVLRVLDDDGILLISTPEKHLYNEVGGVNPFHLKELTFPELESLVSSRFPFYQIFGQRICYGSIIGQAQDGCFDFTEAVATELISGDVTRLEKGKLALEPMYFVVLAAKQKIELPWKLSFFNSSCYVDDSEVKLEAIKRSLTYRLAMLVTAPLRRALDFFYARQG